jgi:hypothetical protein
MVAEAPRGPVKDKEDLDFAYKIGFLFAIVIPGIYLILLRFL